MTDTCIVNDCDKDGRARGMCWTHYKRWQKHGDADVVLEPGRREPRVKGPTLWIATCPECDQTLGLAATPMACWPFYERHRCPVGGAA